MLSNSPMKLDDAGKPWWTFGHVWLVIAEDYYQRGLNINETLKESGGDMTPAMKGRNHAATPLEDQPR